MIVQMFVLGIDPGLSRCGYSIIEPLGRGRGKAAAIGVIRTAPDMPTPERLASLQVDIKSILDEYAPVAVAVEKVFFYKNLQTAVGVIQACGVILAEAAASGCVIAEYSPTEVKSAIAGDGTADKTQMQSMVKSLLNLAEVPRPADAADAAAMALCYLAYNPRGLQVVAERQKKQTKLGVQQKMVRSLKRKEKC